MKRVFLVDVLECERCGGRIKILAAIHPPEATRFVIPTRMSHVLHEPQFKISRLGFPIQQKRDGGRAGFRDECIYEKPLAVRRDCVLLPVCTLNRGAHMRAKEWNGCTGFEGLTV
jgi:hypothetical protein